MQYDIFISYKRKGTSSATAAYLYELLLRKGYNVFFDRKEMRSGKFNEQLLEHIAAAKDVIILLEDESLQSWFAHKDDAPRRRAASPSRSGRADEPAMSLDSPEEAPYKTDWFCREVMHALSFGQDKNVIPLLLNGYQMPASDDLPPEMKDLAMLQALSLDISEIEETYQKYFVDKEYLKSKPRNLAISRQYQQRGAVVGSFLFYTEAESCELFERGERIITLTDDNDEDHPFCLPVTFAGEHRFRIINNDTCEELRLSRRIEASCQEYIHVAWSPDAPCLWSLSEADIAAQADADTLFRWGRGLYEGTAKNAPDVHRSVLCMERAVAMGHPAACEFVKDHGGVTDKNATDEDAFRWYNMSAEMGNAVAQCALGILYEYGEGVLQDYAKAAEWYAKAAEQGDVDGQSNLGCMYYEGCGVAQDDARAVEWWTKAAEQGHVGAQYNLGLMYVNGRGVAQDYAKAVEWYTKAAEQGHASAQFNLGCMYKNGQGVTQDYAKAIEWYTKAAEQGDARGQYNLGHMYYSGQGVVQDFTKAIEWWIKAGEQGLASAQANVGIFYEKGLGVEPDSEKAAAWYLKCAEQGGEGSYNAAAWAYHLLGRYDEALPWAEKAVEAQPDDSEVAETRATVYQGLGRLDDALVEFRRCLELKEAAGAAEDSLSETRAKIAEVEELLAKRG